uniref:Carbonic anhydrase n=1 Tax=Meloidogyne incognita TaxID=6306 RepID=A0A914L9V3_MELIC
MYFLPTFYLFIFILVDLNSILGDNNLDANLIGNLPFTQEENHQKTTSHHHHNHHHNSQKTAHHHSSSDTSHSWGYEDHNGPHTWGKHCRHGTRQSPIDIRTSNLEFAYINQLHFVNYDQSGAVELKNNGHGVAISGFEKWEPRQRPYIYGGGLTGKYLLLQFHFHWTSDHLYGSEHTINNLHYPVEVHLVHVKEEYNTLTEALEQPDGLAVVGIFMYIGNEGSSMANLETGLKRVVEQDSATLIFNYTVGVHLPPVLDNFYRYQGSLTTPGCDESVIWTLMVEPIPILVQQLETLRAIHGPIFGKRLSVNNRPLQPLNGRRVQFRSSSLNRQKICSNDTFVTKPSGNGSGYVSVLNGLLTFIFAFFTFLAFSNNYYTVI